MCSFLTFSHVISAFFNPRYFLTPLASIPRFINQLLQHCLGIARYTNIDGTVTTDFLGFDIYLNPLGPVIEESRSAVVKIMSKPRT